MGYPSTGFESTYRNSIQEVSKMLEHNHGNHYLIFNLSDRDYDYSKFDEHVVVAGFPDHHSPPISLMWALYAIIDMWLSINQQNVVSVHCLAGKGRTGLCCCCTMLLQGFFNSLQCTSITQFAIAAVNYFHQVRGDGVENPDQIKFVRDFLRSAASYGENLALQIGQQLPRPAILGSLILYTVPIGYSGVFSPQLTVHLKHKNRWYLLFNSCWTYQNKLLFKAFRSHIVININEICRGDLIFTLYNKDVLLFHFSINTQLTPVCSRNELKSTYLPRANISLDKPDIPINESFGVQLICLDYDEFVHTSKHDRQLAIGAITNAAIYEFYNRQAVVDGLSAITSPVSPVPNYSSNGLLQRSLSDRSLHSSNRLLDHSDDVEQHPEEINSDVLVHPSTNSLTPVAINRANEARSLDSEAAERGILPFMRHASMSVHEEIHTADIPGLSLKRPLQKAEKKERRSHSRFWMSRSGTRGLTVEEKRVLAEQDIFQSSSRVIDEDDDSTDIFSYYTTMYKSQRLVQPVNISSTTSNTHALQHNGPLSPQNDYSSDLSTLPPARSSSSSSHTLPHSNISIRTEHQEPSVGSLKPVLDFLLENKFAQVSDHDFVSDDVVDRNSTLVSFNEPSSYPNIYSPSHSREVTMSPFVLPTPSNGVLPSPSTLLSNGVQPHSLSLTESHDSMSNIIWFKCFAYVFDRKSWKRRLFVVLNTRVVLFKKVAGTKIKDIFMLEDLEEFIGSSTLVVEDSVRFSSVIRFVPDTHSELSIAFESFADICRFIPLCRHLSYVIKNEKPITNSVFSMDAPLESMDKPVYRTAPIHMNSYSQQLGINPQFTPSQHVSASSLQAHFHFSLPSSLPVPNDPSNVQRTSPSPQKQPADDQSPTKSESSSSKVSEGMNSSMSPVSQWLGNESKEMCKIDDLSDEQLSELVEIVYRVYSPSRMQEVSETTRKIRNKISGFEFLEWLKSEFGVQIECLSQLYFYSNMFYDIDEVIGASNDLISAETLLKLPKEQPIMHIPKNIQSIIHQLRHKLGEELFSKLRRVCMFDYPSPVPTLKAVFDITNSKWAENFMANTKFFLEAIKMDMDADSLGSTRISFANPHSM